MQIRHVTTAPTVVGYFNKPQKAINEQTGLPAPAGIISFQWEAINGETRKVNGTLTCPEEDAVESYPDGSFDETWIDRAIEIQIREPDGNYTMLYWCADAYDPELGVATGWADDAGNLDIESTISLGQGAWLICHSKDSTLSISGAVATESLAVGGDCVKGEFTNFLLAGSAVPVQFHVNDTENVTWVAKAGVSYPEGEFDEGWIDNASVLQIREPDGNYTILYYCEDAYDPELGIVTGWADDAGNFAVGDENGLVQVGGGFWMATPVADEQGKKLIYVTVKNPLAK